MLGIHSVNALSGLYLIVTASGSLFIAMLTLCQCPLGLIPHCYSVIYWSLTRDVKCVNALSGLYLIVTLMIRWYQQRTRKDVSMPSRAYTSLLPYGNIIDIPFPMVCQCPLGLIPHCYSTPSKT